MHIDYHCHTEFSADSHALMPDQCRAAIHRGIQQIAFTEHEDYNPRDATSFFFKHANYMQAIGRCQAEFNGQLVIRAGIEISEPHKHAADVHAVLTNHEWDFVLVSLHWLNSGEVNAINAGKEEFILSTHDWQQSFRDYFTEMATMAREGDFDVLAHIDYPARYNRRYFGNGYDIGLFEDDVRNVLRQVIARGKGIEINTSPWRRGLPDPNPPAKVIHWFREMGGEVLTVGSDAHAPKDVGAGIDRALAIARAAGFTHIATFHNRQVRFERLSSG